MWPDPALSVDLTNVRAVASARGLPDPWATAHYAVAMRDPADDAALVALLRMRPEGLTWSQITEEVQNLGSAMELWRRLTEQTLFSGSEQHELHQAQSDLDAWDRAGTRFLSILSHEYPARVRSIREAPPFLTARGTLPRNGSELAISVVGSRKASDRGRQMAYAIATGLARAGHTVLSGLAAGIDGTAHQAALDSGGRTVALIGTGVNRHYPAENRELQRRIEREGLVLSQFWPDGPPQAHNFLMRNAVMSGYGRATVVVEAGEKSGARAQARMAVEHGRPVILTDQVVEQNEWPRTILGRPRVYVAGSVGDVLDSIDKIVSTEGTAASIAAQLVPELA